MPVTIGELNINAFVSGESSPANPVQVHMTEADRDLIIAECLDQVRELFNDLQNQR